MYAIECYVRTVANFNRLIGALTVPSLNWQFFLLFLMNNLNPVTLKLFLKDAGSMTSSYPSLYYLHSDRFITDKLKI